MSLYNFRGSCYGKNTYNLNLGYCSGNFFLYNEVGNYREKIIKCNVLFIIIILDYI